MKLEGFLSEKLTSLGPFGLSHAHPLWQHKKSGPYPWAQGRNAEEIVTSVGQAAADVLRLFNRVSFKFGRCRPHGQGGYKAGHESDQSHQFSSSLVSTRGPSC